MLLLVATTIKVLAPMLTKLGQFLTLPLLGKSTVYVNNTCYDLIFKENSHRTA